MPYITEYSTLHPKELRQLSYKRRFKQEVPAWDDSMVLLKNELEKRLKENADPSYTSFNTPTYLLSKWFSVLPFSFCKPHLVVILKKIINPTIV